MSEFSHPELTEQMPGLETITNPRLYEISQAALQIENPLHRGMILGSVAGHLYGQAGFEETKNAAVQAHNESLDPRWNDGWQEFAPETVHEHIAKCTKDAAMLLQLKPSYSRDKALAVLAFETGDESLIPSNERDGRDTYFALRAVQSGNIQDVAQIERPYARVMAYRKLMRQFEAAAEDTKVEEVFEAAWRDIPNEPNESDRAALYTMMVTSFPVAERISDPIIRIHAYEKLYYNIYKDGPEALETYRTQSTAAIIRTIEEAQDTIDPKALSDAAFRIFNHTKDPALVPYITGEDQRNAVERDITFIALRAMGAGVHISTAPHSHQQGTHMHEVALEIKDEDEARTIEDVWWRNQALCYVSAKMEDGEQKVRIQNEVVESIITAPRSDSAYTQSSDLVSFVEWMDDVRVAWRLLDDPRVTCYTIAELTEHFEDEKLALQIADDRPDYLPHNNPSTSGMFRRDHALSQIAQDKNDPTIARHIRHPQVRAEALLYVYEKELNEQKDPA